MTGSASKVSVAERSGGRLLLRRRLKGEGSGEGGVKISLQVPWWADFQRGSKMCHFFASFFASILGSILGPILEHFSLILPSIFTPVFKRSFFRFCYDF